VATVVVLISFTRAMTTDINNKLEKYGANILAVPETDTLPLSYGGLSIGGISFEIREINQADLAGIGRIKNAANVAAVGPMVLGGINIGEKRVLLAGLDKKGLISLVEIAAPCSACPITELVQQISGVLPGARVMAIYQVVKGRMETLQRFKKFHTAPARLFFWWAAWWFWSP